MKKRILFVMHYLELGGAETALIGLLNAIDYSKFDVDLFLHSHRGEMLPFVPKEVNLLPEIPLYAQIERPMKAVLKDGYLGMVLARIAAKIRSNFYYIKHRNTDSSAGLQYIANAVTPMLPSINSRVEYDLAISFLCPHNIVRDKVRARQKACWIHTDYSTVDVNRVLELPVWDSYDKVISISPDVTRSFLLVFPSLKDKIVLMENILSPTFVRDRSNEFDPSEELYSFIDNRANTTVLLSIGRFSHPKNFERIPFICRKLIDNYKKSVVWFIIGYGEGEGLIRQNIQEAGMEKHVIILGKKTNPYPYIKACDYYVQPSRYEGKSVTVREAQILYKPVVVTNYPTASSQIRDGIDGVIVPMDNDGCAEGIFSLMEDCLKQASIVQYLQAHDYGNESAVNVLYGLV